MFLGLDSSTQSLTAVVLDPGTGRIVRTEALNFGAELPHYGAPNGFIPGGAAGEVHADPRMWLEALDRLLERLAAAVDLGAVSFTQYPWQIKLSLIQSLFLKSSSRTRRSF